MNARRRGAPSLVAIAAAIALGLGGCSGLGARILSVGQSVDVEGLTVTYLGAIVEDYALTGTRAGNEVYPGADTTDFVRYVFEVTNPSEGELKAREVLPASFVYGSGEDEEMAFPTPGYLAKDADGNGDETIAPGATEEVSLVVEIPRDQAEHPELLTTTLDLNGQAYEIQGDTIEQGGDFQETSLGVADDFAELLMTRYQDFVYTAGEQAVDDPETAYETVRDAAETSAAAIDIYEDELSSAETPELYDGVAAPLEAMLERFGDYFDRLAQLKPSDPGACAATIDKANRQFEAELPEMREEAEDALVSMPYLRDSKFENLVSYFDDLTNYDVNAVERLDVPEG